MASSASTTVSYVDWTQRLFTYTIIPLLLLITTPNTVMIIWYTNTFCGGSFGQMIDQTFKSHGPLGGMMHIWNSTHGLTVFGASVVLGYMLWALVLMKLVPGPTVYGPITEKGHVPQYTDNGFRIYLINLVSLFSLTVYLKTFHNVSPTIIYDRFDDILNMLNVFSLLFCMFLYLKGILAPSTKDSGTHGNPIFDYYWGTELYPRIFGYDVKVFTNCRFGMSVWPLLCIVYAMKSYELHGFLPDSMAASVGLQLLYCTKFFWWEAGYMKTIDIMTDRAGFYICWGCLVWIEGYYVSTTHYLVTHPIQLGVPVALGIFTVGTMSLAANYWADKQRMRARETNGETTIFGKKPVLLQAKYRLTNGDEQTSLLLASGFWGVSRHFNYIPEILLALCWSVPALFDNVLPYCYVVFLILLLVHRSERDDRKCRAKYGQYWKRYCQLVPYKLIPYLY